MAATVTQTYAEYSAFQQCFHELADLLAPISSEITTQLFSEGLVGLTALRDAQTIGIPDYQKISNTLQFIQSSIGRDCGKFDKFLGVLRTKPEVCDLADKLEACRNTISRSEAARHQSVTRGLPFVASTSPLTAPLGERCFQAMAGTPSAPKRPSTILPPSNLSRLLPSQLVDTTNRNSTSVAATAMGLPLPATSTPLFLSRPVPCTDKDRKDTPHLQYEGSINHNVDERREVTGLEKCKCECEIKRLEEALTALQIEDSRKLNDRDLTVSVLSLTVKDLRAERDGLLTERDDLRVYACYLSQTLEESQQDRAQLGEQLKLCEEELKRSETVHRMEVQHVKQQLQAEADEKMTLSQALEDGRHKFAQLSEQVKLYEEERKIHVMEIQQLQAEVDETIALSRALEDSHQKCAQLGEQLKLCEEELKRSGVVLEMQQLQAKCGQKDGACDAHGV